MPLEYEPRTRSIYSDLGFMLLEEVIRRVTSRELPAFAGEAVFGPLGMTSTTFDFAKAQRGDHASPHAEDFSGKPAVGSGPGSTSQA